MSSSSSKSAFFYFTLVGGGIAVFLLLFSQNLTNRGFERHTPLLSLSATVKQRVTESHLYFEESISGDQTVNLQKEVYDLMDEAASLTEAARSGGDTRLGPIEAVADPGTRQTLADLRQGILAWKQSAMDRMADSSREGVGSASDTAFDKNYADILAAADQVSRQISQYIEEDRGQARLANIATVILILGFFAGMMFLENRFRRQLEKQNAELEQGVRDRTQKLEESSWLQAGQASIGERMQGDKELPDMCRETLGQICQYLGASVGALFVRDEGRFRMLASYAFHERKWLDTVIEPGQGLMGQAILEKEVMVVTRIPADYIRVQSALGEAPPVSLALVPLVRGGEVEGAIELGFLQPVSAACLQLLRQVGPHVAVNLHSGQARRRMKELLEETRNQAEELQTQKEELRTINEELEEQARTLQMSESRLREQSVELQRTNEVLQGRSRELEVERAQVDRKNEALIEATKVIEEKAKDLEQTSAYKSEFLAVMSHELRTPLNSIMLLSQLLADNDEGNLSMEQVDQLQTINKGGEDLLTLINQILDLSKIEAGKLEIHREPIDPRLLAEEMTRFFSQTARTKGLELEVSIDPGLGMKFHTDPLRLGQVLKNFLSNAIKFTSHGSVSLRFERPHPGFLPRREDLRGRPIMGIHVRDTGMGIPREKQDLIFEAFEQVDSSISRRFGGTGLGLSISRELTQLLGGEIHLESQEGTGSTFSVYLPMETQEIASLPSTSVGGPGPSRTPPPPARSLDVAPVLTASPGEDASLDPSSGPDRLLIIEDDPGFARQLAAIASNRGQITRLAHTARDGLALAREWKPHGIILDLILPDRCGEDVLDELKATEATRDIPVHVISGKEDIDLTRTTDSVGVSQKPLKKETILAALDRLALFQADRLRRILILSSEGIHLDPADFPDRRVEIETVREPEKALESIRRQSIDCLLLEDAFEQSQLISLVRQLRADPRTRAIPAILVLKDAARAEGYEEIQDHVDRILLEDGDFHRRLLDETTLFLNRLRQAPIPGGSTRSPGGSRLAGKKVLVADDDPRNIYSVTRLLESWEIEVTPAAHGVEALRILDDRSNIDLVLMDIMMPEMDGLEAMRRIRKNSRLREMPVIALTAKAMKADREECLQAGASDYLPKPIDRSKLRSLLEVWMT